MSARYVIVDLNVALVLAVRDDLGEALYDADFEPFSFPAWEERPDLLKEVDQGLYSPDIVVLDQEDDLLYAPHRGDVVCCWWDAFTRRWRRVLAVAA